MNSHLRLPAFILLASLALAAAPLEPRKRVGLALAGGGAKGLAHIGVLRWLEENQIPVDAIAGTSMGGLIAGAYAGGRDSGQIRELVDAIDWGEALSARPDYRGLAFRRKEDWEAYPAEIELGLKGGQLRLPTGLNPAHQIGLLMSELGFPYSGVQTFDELPTPFRCVATDLLSGEEVVFLEGSFSQALRATMSLPGIFTPVSYEDMLLVDGGVVNNIPVDVVRGMDVDVVIAVDLGMERSEKEDIASLLSVAGRSIEIMIRRNSIQSLKAADLVVEPAVSEFSTLGFSEVGSIVDRGYQAAEQLAAALGEFSASDEEWREHLEARRRKIRDFGVTPEFVEITGNTEAHAKTLEARLSEFGDAQLDVEELERKLTRVTGLGPYEAAHYSRTDRDGRTGLGVNLIPKSYGPPFVRPLLVLDTGHSGNSSFTIGGRITALNSLSRGSEWRNDFSLGRIRAVSSEYFQLAGTGGLFVAPRAFLNQEQQLIFDDRGRRLADYKLTRRGGGLDVGYIFGRFSEVRTGVELSDSRASIIIGDPALPSVKGVEKIWATRWRVNALNDAAIPTQGFFTDTQINWQFGSPRIVLENGEALPRPESFGQAWNRTTFAQELGNGWSGLLRTQSGATFAGAVQPLAQFRLGGPLRLSALETGERRGGYAAYGSASALKLLRESPTAFMSKLYGTVIYEFGDAFDSRPEFSHNGAIGILAQTKLGVLFAGSSYGEQGRHRFLFSVGRIF